jgi:hypothetical protein
MFACISVAKSVLECNVALYYIETDFTVSGRLKKPFPAYSLPCAPLKLSSWLRHCLTKPNLPDLINLLFWLTIKRQPIIQFGNFELFTNIVVF